MAPKVPPAIKAELQRLAQALEKRTGPMSEEGAKALQRLSPEAQVTLDELLGKGAALGEVSGAGTGLTPNPVMAQWGNATPLRHRANPPSGGAPENNTYWPDLPPMSVDRPPTSVDRSEVPIREYDPYSASGQVDAIERLARQTATQARQNAPPGYQEDAFNPVGEGALNRIFEVRGQNRVLNADKSRLPVGPWPDSWSKWENIPGAVLGAGLGAGVLASGKAQAQENDGLQVEGDWSAGLEPVAQPSAPDWAQGLEAVSDGQQAQLPDEMRAPPAAPAQAAPVEAPYEQGGQQFTDNTNDYSQPPPIEKYGPGLVNAAMEAIPFKTVQDPFFAGAQKFKSKFIDPVVTAVQTKERERYEKRIAPGLRAKSPVTALVYENLAQLAMGKTDMTMRTGPDGEGLPNENPAYLQAQAELEQTLGVTGAAAAQSLLSEMSQLPIYLIPGKGESAIAQGATSGFLTGLVEPGADVKAATLGGAAVGGVLEAGLKAGVKVGGAAWAKFQRIRGKTPKVFEPIAIIPAQEEAKLVDEVLKMENEPQKIMAAAQDLSPGSVADSPRARERKAQQQKVAAVVGLNEAGEPVVKVLSAGKLGLGAAETKLADVSDKLPKILSDEVKKAVAADPNSALAFELYPAPKGGLPAEQKIIDLSDFDANLHNEVREGSVLVIEGGGGDGTARLYQVNDPVLQREVLRKRGVVEVVLKDGTHAVGFHGSGDVLVRPDPGELIPNAAKRDISLQSDEVLNIIDRNSDKDLDAILAGRTKLLEAADAEVERAAADAAFRAEDIANGGDGSGGNRPPPPPMDPPPPPPPNPHNVDPSEGIKLQYTNGLFGRALTYAQRKMVNPTVRGPQDVADLAFMSHSVNTLERLAPDVMRSLNQAFPQLAKKSAVEQRGTHEALNRYMEGHITLDKLKELQPELQQQIHGKLQAYKAQIAANDARLRELGMISDTAGQAVDTADEDYLTRLYYRYLMREPGAWAKMAKKDAQGVRALQDAIKQDVYSGPEYATMNDADHSALAARHLDFLLGDPKVIAAAKSDPEASWAKTVNSAGGSLKQRHAMPWWKKAALGELDNSFVRIAESMARQEQLILQGHMWNEVSITPSMSTPGDAPGLAKAVGHTEPLPMNPALYGRSAGRYVSPDVFEALVQAPLAQRNASTTTSKFLNAIKYGQTVGNPGSWVSNFFGNAQGVALSNLVNPFSQPLAVGRGMLTFARDLQAHKLNPGLVTDAASLRFKRAMELGVVGSDYSSAEFRDGAELWMRTLEREAKRNGGRVNPLDLFPDLLRSGAHKGAQGKELLAKLYGGTDTLWKYATYSAGLEKAGMDLKSGVMNEAKALKFLKGTSHYKEGLSGESLREAVELEVVQRIHYAFPMLDRVGEGVAAMGKGAGTVVNPYFKIKAELMRNYAQLPARMVREPGMKANMLAWTTTVGGMYYGMKYLRETQGVNQDEVDASFKSAPSGVQRFKPGAMALWHRTDNGRLRFVDLTSMFEPFSWMTGNPDTAAPARILKNVAFSAVDGSLLEPGLSAIGQQNGWVDPEFQRRNVPEWQQSSAKMVGDTMLRYGPGIFRNTYNTLERGGVGFAPRGVRGPEQAPQTPFTTGANLLLGPNRFFETGGAPGGAGEADRTRAIQAKDAELRAASGEMQRLGAMNEGQSTGLGTGPLDRKEAMAKQRAIIERLKLEMRQLQTDLGRR